MPHLLSLQVAAHIQIVFRQGEWRSGGSADREGRGTTGCHELLLLCNRALWCQSDFIGVLFQCTATLEIRQR